MLFRFLTIATVSVAYLSAQAISSTETKSQRLQSVSAITIDHMSDLPNLQHIALISKRQASQTATPPVPLSFKTQKIKSKRTALLAAKHKKAKQRAALKAKKARKTKKFIRLAYMPPSYLPKTAKKIRKKNKKRITKAKTTKKVAVISKNNKVTKPQIATLQQPVAKNQGLTSLLPQFSNNEKPYKKVQYSLGAAKAPKKVKKYYKKKKRKKYIAVKAKKKIYYKKRVRRKNYLAEFGGFSIY